MKKALNYGVLVLVIGLSALMMGFGLKRYSNKSVGEVSMLIHDEKGLFITDEIVNNLLKQNGDSLKNQLNSELNLHNLEHRIAAHPMIEEVLVYQDVNGDLGVEIYQKTPVLRLFVDERRMYLDQQGGLMPWSTYFTARVPVYHGEWNKEIQSSVFELIQWIRSDKFWNRECVAISYDQAEGWSLQTRSADHKIIVGELTHLEKKLRKYEIFLVTAMNQGLADSYEKVNLKFNNQVVCSK